MTTEFIRTLYLAGPGVFRADAVAWGARLQAACQAHGWQGLYPLDNAISAASKAEQAQQIFAGNCALIHAADAVLADVRAFRSGSEPDSGTAFEIGYAHALGKPVWLWLPAALAGQDMRSRIGAATDADGLQVEDFGAPLNLMLWQAAAGVVYADEPESALLELDKVSRETSGSLQSAASLLK
ncbi:Nucleoside 2-deoxyribosyltransferase [Andreprevotia lacus DSM 23236]|jgi:nucleoside deoxyribosyltransferase|uniref:Nucleoside 2-deoxyribosyltransferase n=1 Tax=Andreprevotia lacus DSM 23236 TaxID=1121001 RepID=A0A1W1XAY3_9NEIS|nr:nucleoside 2-deoxyribosyltransferase [Andreprevotia lacus]SMC21096.1 Nucleoside 2-deoxyribosyltransferase [Andreprevotia lacus DSM 23236]